MPIVVKVGSLAGVYCYTTDTGLDDGAPVFIMNNGDTTHALISDSGAWTFSRIV
jgi:hypothetical protein